MTHNRPPVPTLLGILGPLSLGGAVIAALTSVALVRASPYDNSMLELLSPYGLWFIRVLLFLAITLGVLLFLVYRGLARRRRWVRPLIVSSLAYAQVGSLVLAVLGPSEAAVAPSDFTPIALLLASIAYLYFKPNVVAYFASWSTPRSSQSVA